MASRRRSSRGASKGQKNQIWTVSLLDDFELTTGVTIAAFSPVIDTDWQRGTAPSFERATVMRMRGWFTVVQKLTAGLADDGTVFSYCLLHDEDATAPPGNISTSYTEEDILWTGGHLFGEVERVITVEGGSSIAESQWSEQFDVKAMRRIRSGQAIDLVFTNLLAGSVRISGCIRTLLRLGGN